MCTYASQTTTTSTEPANHTADVKPTRGYTDRLAPHTPPPPRSYQSQQPSSWTAVTAWEANTFCKTGCNPRATQQRGQPNYDIPTWDDCVTLSCLRAVHPIPRHLHPPCSLGTMREVSFVPSLVPEPAFDPVVLGGAFDDPVFWAADHLDDDVT